MDDLWLTDTSFTNESLVSEHTGKAPEFPSPFMLHFKKDRFTYRTFAGNLVIGNPNLLHVTKIGSDMDSALHNGIGDIFNKADRLICIQHLMERDAEKLNKLGAAHKDKQRILADIYGSKQDKMLQFGLADADNEQDFVAKFESLMDLWESLVPYFHAWFGKHRCDLFKTTIIWSAKDRIGIGDSFYNNRLEVMHKLQKKKAKEASVEKEATAIINLLKEWVNSYRTEAVRAVRGLGKYRLAPGYQQFAVDPVRWMRWSVDRQEQHCSVFFNYIPTVSETFQKPMNAGLKCKVPKKRRRDPEEPELFLDRIESTPKSPALPYSLDAKPSSSSAPLTKKVTPIKIQKVRGEYSAYKSSTHSATTLNTVEMDPLDPMRAETHMYHLVHREDTKNCPRQVKRCEQCRFQFTNADIVIVRTNGVREFTCPKTGKLRKQSANVYLHYLRSCLKGYDGKFQFPAIVVLRDTLKLLPDSSIEKFKQLITG